MMSFSSVEPDSSLVDSHDFTSSCETLGEDYFDEYLARNPEVKVEHCYPDLSASNLLRSTSNCDSMATSADPLDDDSEFSIQRDEADRDLWTPTSSIPHDNSIYPQSFGKAAMSESELLHFRGINLHSPKTPTRFQKSSSQSPYVTATFLRRSGGITDTPSRSSRNQYTIRGRNSVRKSSSCPKMMRNSRRSDSDLWTASIGSSGPNSNFYRQEGTVPYMSSQCFSTPENPATRGLGEIVPYTEDAEHNLSVGPFDFDTPLSTPTSFRRRIVGIEEELQVSDPSLMPRFDYASGEWCSSLDLMDPPVYDMPSTYTSDQDSPVWWSDATSVPMAQPSPTRLHVNPRRATGSVAVQLQNKISHSFNALPYRPVNKPLESIYCPADVFAMDETVNQQFSPAQAQSEYPSQAQQHNAVNPSAQPPRLVRKPKFGPGDIIVPSPAPSPELEVRKRKSPGKPPEQCTPSLEGSPAPASVGFVNYTPDDSMRILTGVAPSGSSRTKARREKEALEKRRKLSQAAVRAVRAAGGDIKVLTEEGLLL